MAMTSPTAATSFRHANQGCAHSIRTLFSKHSAEAALQRKIEDCLMRISALSTTINEDGEVTIESSRDAEGRQIKDNQCELLTELETLTSQLSWKQRGVLVDGMHPATSHSERETLQTVMQNRLEKELVPAPLNVRKVSPSEGMKEAMKHRRFSAIPAPLKVTKPRPPNVTQEGLHFPELLPEEAEVRRRELASAKAEQSNAGQVHESTPTISSENGERSTTTSRKRSQEVANILTRAARKLQEKEESSSVARRSISSPVISEVLQSIKTATTALLEYTDVTPREVTVRERRNGVQAGGRTPKPKGELSTPRCELSLGSPFTIPRELKPRHPWDETSTTLVGASTTPAPPPKRTPQSKPEPSLTQVPLSENRLTPNIRSGYRQAPAPHPGPRATSCPFPESFFTTPRPAPSAPSPSRVVSLPHPAKAPFAPTQSSGRDGTNSAETQTAEKRNHEQLSRRQGSIHAARAGIADRIRREQVEVLQGNLPYERSKVRKFEAGRTPAAAASSGMKAENQADDPPSGNWI